MDGVWLSVNGFCGVTDAFMFDRMVLNGLSSAYSVAGALVALSLAGLSAWLLYGTEKIDSVKEIEREYNFSSTASCGLSNETYKSHFR